MSIELSTTPTVAETGMGKVATPAAGGGVGSTGGSC